MRQAIAKFEEKDTQVLGISVDSRATQAAFASSLGSIPYPILADFHPKGRVAQLYGIYNEKRGTADRCVILIDKQGIVRFNRVYSSMADFSTDNILSEIDGL